MKTLFLVIVGIALAFALSVEAKSSPSEDLTPQNEPDLGDIAEFKNAGTDLMWFCHHFFHHLFHHIFHHICHHHYHHYHHYCHHYHHWCHHFYPEGEALNFKDSPALSQDFESLLQGLFSAPNGANN